MKYTGEDRVELTRRFAHAYRLLEGKGVIQKNHPTKSKSAVAELLLGSKQYGHIITKFLDGKREIKYQHARIFCNEFGISEAYLFDGIGDPFDNKQKSDSPTLPTPSGNIIYTNVSAFAGTPILSDLRENSYSFALPGLKGTNLVAFNVEGNSMEPILNNGDLIICREIDHISDIRENTIYAVRNNGEVKVKFVQPIFRGGRIVALNLISANYLEYAPVEEEVNLSTQIFKVVRRISNL